jgi:hypothetical protein
MNITAQAREIMRLPVRRICTMAALSLAPGVLVLSGIPDAYAQKKKLTYEQAFAMCKKDVDSTFPSREYDTAGRYARGGACMKQQGFNLKKAAKF